jgi:hypothetical protein
MRSTTILSAAAALGALLATSPAAQAGVTGYTFTEIAVPGSTGTIGAGINDRAAVFRVKRLEGATACDP